MAIKFGSSEGAAEDGKSENPQQHLESGILSTALLNCGGGGGGDDASNEDVAVDEEERAFKDVEYRLDLDLIGDPKSAAFGVGIGGNCAGEGMMAAMMKKRRQVRLILLL